MRTPRSTAGWTCTAFSVLLGVGLTFLAALSYARSDRWLAMFLGTLGCATWIAAALRLGWPVPGMVSGTFIGFMLDARPKSGDTESQMWETVGSIALGAILGLALGLAAEELRGNRESITQRSDTD